MAELNSIRRFEAKITEVDILVVDRSIEPAHGKIVIAVGGGEFTVKTLYCKDGIIKLVPANPEQELNVWGIVTYIIHKAR